MRIAIVTETFVPATDGICTRLANFVVQLKEIGHEVIVISPDLGISDYKGVPVYGRNSDISIIWIASMGFTFSKGKVYFQEI